MKNVLNEADWDFFSAHSTFPLTFHQPVKWCLTVLNRIENAIFRDFSQATNLSTESMTWASGYFEKITHHT